MIRILLVSFPHCALCVPSGFLLTNSSKLVFSTDMVEHPNNGHSNPQQGVSDPELPLTFLSPMRVCMSPTDDPADSTDQHWLLTETPDDWIGTDHERIYFRQPYFEDKDEYITAGEKIAEAFPEWTVIITGGRFRSHDVRYYAHAKTKRILLDFYLVNPGIQYLDCIIRDISQEITE